MSASAGTTSASPRRRSARRQPPHPWLYALPEGRLPDMVECRGRKFALVQTFKHDFFAATGLYQRVAENQSMMSAAPAVPQESSGPETLFVAKINRVGPFFGIPLRWIGRLLGRREIALYRAVQDLPGVPAYLGPVGDTGFLHAYVPGHPLERYEAVSDAFFDELQALIAALHVRGIAYVDLNKRQNILMGDDGRPYLIDFQISLRLTDRGWGRLPGARWFLRRFQHGDVYHVLKHKRRLRPDLLTPEELRVVERLSIWIRLHRAIARPLTQLRRRLLRQVRAGEETAVAGSGTK